ncbi:hypothetical protein LAZ67_X003228 [Cordylochernes scorpioides]|uniref:Retroviral polymerase SH3-like domain-containing protein n=1 Tax=Cordylochernes scorpioides TaxID=51811 RepID=A0ABY6LUH5_9ARAC|nr:hypothetical protein LAZ67_X003228 [Cordylochernes scorpioides]
MFNFCLHLTKTKDFCRNVELKTTGDEQKRIFLKNKEIDLAEEIILQICLQVLSVFLVGFKRIIYEFLVMVVNFENKTLRIAVGTYQCARIEEIGAVDSIMVTGDTVDAFDKGACASGDTVSKAAAPYANQNCRSYDAITDKCCEFVCLDRDIPGKTTHDNNATSPDKEENCRSYDAITDKCCEFVCLDRDIPGKTTHDNNATSPDKEENPAYMQPRLDDLVSRLTDAIRGLAAPCAGKNLIAPFDGSYAASTFFQQLEQTSEEPSDDTTRHVRLRALLKGEPLSLYNELSLASQPYDRAKQILKDLYPGTSGLTFTKFMTYRLNSQTALSDYYRQKVAMGLQLGLTNPIIVEALTEGLQANDQRLMRAVAPQTLTHCPKLSQRFWAEAVNTAAYIRNKCYNSALGDKVPDELWSSRKPSVRHLKAFGCLAYSHIPTERRKKLDNRANRCILVGYSSQTKGYHLWCPETQHGIQTKHVKFDESKIGLKWTKVEDEPERYNHIWIEPDNQLEGDIDLKLEAKRERNDDTSDQDLLGVNNEDIVQTRLKRIVRNPYGHAGKPKVELHFLDIIKPKVASS